MGSADRVRSAALLWLLTCLAASHPVPAAALLAQDGSRLVRLTAPKIGADETGVQNLRLVGRQVFFTASFPGAGQPRYGLWRTAGRPASTRMVKRATFPRDPYALYEVAGAGARVFFTRDATPEGERELWVTNGRRTRLLTRRWAENLIDVAGTLYFSSFQDDSNVLWTSTGTPNGTRQVAVITDGRTGLYVPTMFTAVGRQVFFFADDGTHTFTLHASDGVATRTVRLAAASPVLGGHTITDLGGVALVTDVGHLLRSDGTPAGTELLLDVTPAAIDRSVTVNGTRAFFVVRTNTGQALWSTDGTVAGTHLVADGAQGQRFADPTPLGVLQDVLHFSTADAGEGPGLWRTDGTDAGTVRITTLPPGRAIERGALEAVSGALFFVTQDEQNGSRDIWRTDGTVAGTVQVTDEEGFSRQLLAPRNLSAVGNTLFFTSLVERAGRTEHALWALRPRVAP